MIRAVRGALRVADQYAPFTDFGDGDERQPMGEALVILAAEIHRLKLLAMAAEHVANLAASSRPGANTTTPSTQKEEAS